MSTNGAYGDEMEVNLFTDALRAAVPTQPSPDLTTTTVPRLAAAARSATIEAETQASRRSGTRVGSRRALVAKVAVAVAAIPLLLAGLAFAGVTVPATARDAFDSLGITLPNQPSTHSSASEATQQKGHAPKAAGGNDVSTAAHAKAKGKGGNSGAAHEHALTQHEKAQGKATGHGRGKAVGLNDSTPPGHSVRTGPPTHSNAGGNAGGSSASHSTVKPTHPTHPTHPTPEPNGAANGPTKPPPGQSK